MATPVQTALTIAGSDSSGGAGIQADLKTFAAFGVYGASVVTALTAQNTQGVSGVHGAPQEFIRAQFDAVASDLAIAAIKTGMLGDSPTVSTVCNCLDRLRDVPVVVDPVMVATSGDVLLAPDAIATLRDRLLPLADVLTPNLPEAARLLGVAVATRVADAADQARALLALGPRAVLVKGGHGTGPTVVDLLATADGVIAFENPRIDTPNTHGTGCTLSAAICAGLAEGASLIEAVRVANSYVARAIRSGATRRIGHGRGPLDHRVTVRIRSNGAD